MDKKIKVASFFLSMEIGTSWWAGKVHATLGKIIDHNFIEPIYIQLSNKQPRYEHDGEIINLHEQFYVWFWLKKVISLFRLAYRIKKICQEHHIDILLWQGDFFFMVTGLSKLLWNKSHCIGLVHTTLRIWPSRLQTVLGWFLKHNNIVVCISEEEKIYLSQYYHIKDEKLFLIHNSIDIKQLEKDGNETIADRDIRLFRPWKFTYLSVGRFSSQKNFKLLIDAFHTAYKKNQDIQLVIIGDGEEYQDLVQYVLSISMEDDIHLIGKRHNPMSYMKYANCFVMSSKFEWYPMVLLEACVWWLPIVSLDCPTWPSEVIWDNEGGILVPYIWWNHNRNIQSLAAWLSDIRNKDLSIISTRNKEFVKQYDNKIIWERRDKLLQSIVDKQ